ncbi:MAG: hypothetical protein U0519_02925 [Candidatus Gracilibacteria bacterium]
MSKQRTAILLAALAITMIQFQIVSAAGMEIIPTPTDLPPGAMSYGNVAKGGLDPNIVAAVIGVVGLLVGSFLTIMGTYFLRFLDVRREDKREEAFMVRERKEKEFQIKQEIYKNFLTDLGFMEGFLLNKADAANMKDTESFNAEWTKMEIKMNLVCSAKIRQLLDELQEILVATAKKRFEGGKVELAGAYLEKRGELLDAIREDIDLFQSN